MEKISPKQTKEHKLPSGVLAASVSPNGKTIAAACMNGVYRIDLESGQPRRLYQHDSYVSSVDWVTDDLILSAGYDGAVTWFDANTESVTRRIKLHKFWSWDMALSPDRTCFASVTGQYLAGGYKYEPQAEREPSVRVVSVSSGDVLLSLPHVPSVQAVAISPNNQFVAAANLMGEVRVFDLTSGEISAQWTTPDFTSWGIIKSHCYLGGIFSMRFTPSNHELVLAGMGPMRDPMAGNGRQLWQKWDFKSSQPKLIDQTHEGESGEGLMEALAIHPDGKRFLMAGRLRGGDWNAAFFDLQSGKRLAIMKTGYRITDACFTGEGNSLLLAGCTGQGKRQKDGNFADFGRIEIYQLDADAEEDTSAEQDS